MKNKYILLLLCITTIAQGQLIDLTPGGFDPNNTVPLPPAYYQLQSQTFFDEAVHGWFYVPPNGLEYLNDWLSVYVLTGGAIPGGTYFFTNLFALGDSPSATIWWNFRQQQQGITMIDAWGIKPDGTEWEHIYAVPRNKARREQPVLVTLDGMTIINGIAFYGTDSRHPRQYFRIRDYARRPQ